MGRLGLLEFSILPSRPLPSNYIPIRTFQAIKEMIRELNFNKTLKGIPLTIN